MTATNHLSPKRNREQNSRRLLSLLRFIYKKKKEMPSSNDVALGLPNSSSFVARKNFPRCIDAVFTTRFRRCRGVGMFAGHRKNALQARQYLACTLRAFDHLLELLHCVGKMTPAILDPITLIASSACLHYSGVGGGEGGGGANSFRLASSASAVTELFATTRAKSVSQPCAMITHRHCFRETLAPCRNKRFTARNVQTNACS